MLGAAYTFPQGEGGTNRRCTLAGGTPYITSKEIDVDSAFKCLATVGIGGTNAYAAGAVRAAISPAMNAEGACNDGFLRKDALLVITVIADTGDDDSLDGPKEWAADVLAAKNGDPDAAFLLVITTDINIPGHLCWPEQAALDEEGRLRTWAKMTPNASVQSPDEPLEIGFEGRRSPDRLSPRTGRTSGESRPPAGDGTRGAGAERPRP